MSHQDQDNMRETTGEDSEEQKGYQQHKEEGEEEEVKMKEDKQDDEYDESEDEDQNDEEEEEEDDQAQAGLSGGSSSHPTASGNNAKLPTYRAGTIVNGVYQPPLGGYSCHQIPIYVAGPNGMIRNRHRLTQGLPPHGIGNDQWNKAYNACDSKIYKERGGYNGGAVNGGSVAARSSGETRARTIERLISDRYLPAGFADNNP